MNLVKLLSHCVPTGMKIPILRGPLRGFRWIAGAAAGHGKGLSVVFNSSEPRQMLMARQWTTDQDVCLDLGANVGMYSLLFGRYGKRVYAFEPLPRNLRYLYQAIQINGLRNVMVVPWAVSDKMELTGFAPGENNALGSLCAQGPQPVVCVSCDQFVEAYGLEPSILKIDVEGAELKVLRGAMNLLTARRPKILISFHSDDLRSQCLALLRGCGYGHIEPLDNAPAESANEFAVWAD